MKRLLTIIFIGVLFLFITLNTAAAQFVECNRSISCPTGEFVSGCCPPPPPEGGLVPCGTECCPCKLCHLFVMLDRILDFLLFKLAPALAVLMIVIGGGMLIISRANPETVSRAKKLFGSIVIGLLIVYGAWLLINLFFTVIGLSEFGLRLTGPDKWFIIECP